MKRTLHSLGGTKRDRRSVAASPSRPTQPARPRAKKKAAARAASKRLPKRKGAAWVEWRHGRALINVRRVAAGREVLTGVHADPCPWCGQMGICVNEKWWHEVDVDKERPQGECRSGELERCPECEGTGRVPR